ncbi:MAG: peptidoglycan-binding domain-containing protein, partial [Acidimicrobiia bacterium]
MALTLAACDPGDGREAARAVSTPEAPVSGASDSPLLAPAPPPPVAAAPSPPIPSGSLAPGTEGEPVRLLQERLVALRYDPGATDGRYQAGTTHAVLAFQKVAGLPPTGAATPETVDALNRAGDPVPLL